MTDLNTLSLPGASLIAVIRDDAEALEIANRLAEGFAKTAPYRDRERRLPFAELDRFSQSGLWAITVPAAFGGPDVSYKTVAKVIEIISAADSSLGQIPQKSFERYVPSTCRGDANTTGAGDLL